MINQYYAERLERLGYSSLVERYRNMLPSAAKTMLEQEHSKASQEYQQLGLKQIDLCNARMSVTDPAIYAQMFLSAKESSRQTHLRDLIQVLEACRGPQP